MHRVALEQGQAKSNGLPPFSSSHIHARNTREHPRGDARPREKKKPRGRYMHTYPKGRRGKTQKNVAIVSGDGSQEQVITSSFKGLFLLF